MREKKTMANRLELLFSATKIQTFFSVSKRVILGEKSQLKKVFKIKTNLSTKDGFCNLLQVK